MFLLLATRIALATPLLEMDVVRAVDGRVPELAEALAKQAEAEAKALKARGAFDPTLRSKVEREVTGPYERTTLDAAIGAQTPWGLTLEAGYRLGVGDFPAYYGAHDTLDGGELRLGLTTPLLRDLGMSAERAERLVSDAMAAAARSSAEDKRQRITGKAVEAYWKWVAAGEKLALAEELLLLAETRQQGIEARVAEGALPAMESIDNARVVLERESELRSAERDAATRGLALSWYVRGPDARPAPFEPEAHPEVAPHASTRVGPTATEVIPVALEQRPDVAVLGALVRAAEVEVRRAGTALLPKLEGRAGVARDRGTGDPKLAAPELDLGLSLAVPLAFREGRGELARARAAQQRLDVIRRGLIDRVHLDVEATIFARDAAWDRWALAEEGAVQAAEVVRLELRSFELGTSDIFRLTKREEALAKARKARIEAHLEYRLAATALRTEMADW